MKKTNKILKFGGSALDSKAALQSVTEIITASLSGGGKVVLVASARTGRTNQLLEAAETAVSNLDAALEIVDDFTKAHQDLISEVLNEEQQQLIDQLIVDLTTEAKEVLRDITTQKELSPKQRDQILSYGEIISSHTLSLHLLQSFPQCELIDARKIIRTDESFGAANVDFEKTKELIAEHIDPNVDISVVTGFIASSADGHTTTLGRGGSDYTAAILGSILGASEIEIWTHVDGVMTADPKKVSKAFSLEYLRYEEAMELCHFGARIIYPRTLQPALNAGINITIKNIFKPDYKGTLISENPPGHDLPITGIASISDVSLLLLEGSGMIGVAGVSHRLFGALTKGGISVILISQASSEHSICFAISPDSTDKAKELIDSEFEKEISANQLEPLRIAREHSIVAVVGSAMKKTPGISGKVFQALGKNGINVTAIAQGSSELNISIVIDKVNEQKALNALHDAFFLSDRKTVNVFLIGTGQVGATLLSQMDKNVDHLYERKLELRPIALANSKKAVFNEDGISLKNWQALLNDAPAGDVSSFVDKMIELNLPNSIFVDCTASELVADEYERVLGSSISIVTPNKRANSGSYETYRRLHELADKANVKFFYETNVGAGLPVIGTLHDLINSGDEIIKIEAVLSGTLSYIFNSFVPGTSFSDIVKVAKEKGFTEPDPRDDLSGTDVARKLLILAREMGIPLELEDIEVESLIPSCCKDSDSIDEFFAALEAEDSVYLEKLSDAQSSNSVLRYIGILEGTRARVSMEAVAPSHPFYNLSGSDNIVSFKTSRYFEQPLVVKGPGAGTDVTAAGVLADMIWVSSYLI